MAQGRYTCTQTHTSLWRARQMEKPFWSGQPETSKFKWKILLLYPSSTPPPPLSPSNAPVPQNKNDNTFPEGTTHIHTHFGYFRGKCKRPLSTRLHYWFHSCFKSQNRVSHSTTQTQTLPLHPSPIPPSSTASSSLHSSTRPQLSFYIPTSLPLPHFTPLILFSHTVSTPYNPDTPSPSLSNRWRKTAN